MEMREIQRQEHGRSKRQRQGNGDGVGGTGSETSTAAAGVTETKTGRWRAGARASGGGSGRRRSRGCRPCLPLPLNRSRRFFPGRRIVSRAFSCLRQNSTACAQTGTRRPVHAARRTVAHSAHDLSMPAALTH